MNDEEFDARPQPADAESTTPPHSLRGSNAFMSMLAHELRNCLAPIQNVAAALRMRKTAEPDTRSLSDLIERQVSAIGAMVDGLSEAVRLGGAEVVLEREQVDAVAVVDDAVSACRPQLDRRHQLLHLSLPAGRMVLRADRAGLQYAIRCVIANSSANTPGGGELWIEVSSAADELRLKIRDNGIGIAQSDLPAIFDFFSIEDRRDRPWTPELGLSLAAARRLIELHQGRISVSSGGPGAGREFSICIPLQASAVAVRAERTVAANPQQAVAAPAPGGVVRRILIADDNAAVRESLSALLHDMGHLTRAAAGGTEALQIAREWMPDVVFVDVNMPGINGYELARMFRAEFPRAPVKLVMMSGDAMNDIALRGAKHAGFDQCIDKLSPVPVFENILRGDRP
jgi:CheY-like chemotaxis protein